MYSVCTPVAVKERFVNQTTQAIRYSEQGLQRHTAASKGTEQCHRFVFFRDEFVFHETETTGDEKEKRAFDCRANRLNPIQAQHPVKRASTESTKNPELLHRLEPLCVHCGWVGSHTGSCQPTPSWSPSEGAVQCPQQVTTTARAPWW
ncbi:hypothetical protein BaRGS_00038159 [Batillaria attramentaria]|uniref:Uncharacterized protein n=1 Tax=Batillaria attramentaria TaxID=370345 RepID=A0ABD0J7L7_9CAEN